MKAFLGKYLVQISVVLGLAILVSLPSAAAFWNAKHPAGSNTTAVKKPTTTVTTVSATGTIVAAQTIDLSFQASVSGVAASVQARVGSTVAAGQALVSFSAGTLPAQLTTAQSALAAAQTKLTALLKLPTSTTTTVTVTSTSPTAIAAVAQAQTSVRTAVRNASISADNVIRNQVDQFISNPNTLNPQLTFTIADSQLVDTISTGRASIGISLAAWDKEVVASSFNSASDTAIFSVNAEADINAINSFLGEINTALNDGKATKSLTQSQFSSYESSVTSARLTMSNALNSVTNAEAQEQSARATLAAGTKQATTITPIAPNVTAIANEKAIVTSNQAKVASLQAQIAKIAAATLKAPVAGVITGISASGISMTLSSTDLQVVSYLSAASEAKIGVGNAVDVTVGTSTKSVAATVISIASVTTTPVSYKVISQFQSATSTANAVGGESIKLKIHTN